MNDAINFVKLLTCIHKAIRRVVVLGFVARLVQSAVFRSHRKIIGHLIDVRRTERFVVAITACHCVQISQTPSGQRGPAAGLVPVAASRRCRRLIARVVIVDEAYNQAT